MKMLQIRYHPKFKLSTDTLLFAGTGDDINSLREFFTQWSGDHIDFITNETYHPRLMTTSLRNVIQRQSPGALSSVFVLLSWDLRDRASKTSVVRATFAFHALHGHFSAFSFQAHVYRYREPS